MVVVSGRSIGMLCYSSGCEVVSLKYVVSKRIRIDAAHFLPNYDGLMEVNYVRCC